jgi:hypothetical protein
VHNAATLFNGRGDNAPAQTEAALYLGNSELLIQKLHQRLKHAQRKAGDPQKGMGQDGKGSPALIVFAKVALDADQFFAGKVITLVFAVFDNVDPVVAPMTKNRAGLILLGSLAQIQ